MEGAYDSDEVMRTANFEQDLPESGPVDRVEHTHTHTHEFTPSDHAEIVL